MLRAWRIPRRARCNMTIDDAYNTGYDARQWDSASHTQNPFHPISEASLFKAWFDGWFDRHNWEASL